MAPPRRPHRTGDAPHLALSRSWAFTAATGLVVTILAVATGAVWSAVAAALLVGLAILTAVRARRGTSVGVATAITTAVLVLAATLLAVAAVVTGRR